MNDFILQQRLGLALQAGKIGSTHVDYTPIADFIDNVVKEFSQTLTKEQVAACEPSVELKTQHKFLSLVKETESVFLKADDST